MRCPLRMGVIFFFIFSCGVSISCSAQNSARQSGERDYTKLAVEGDLVVHNFKFHAGEMLPELHLHYATWGTPKKNSTGEITNAALLLHGTMSTGIGFGNPNGAVPGPHPLLGPGGALDSSIYFVIAPDTIGAGKSSKPSDGMRMGFPHYNLVDIVAAEKLIVEHLGVHHLRVIAGASMGGRQTWQWGVQYPEFMDAMVPMISSPFPNSGRRALVDFVPEAIIKESPEFKDGNYTKNPSSVHLALLVYGIFTSGAGALQESLPTRADAEKRVFDDANTSMPDATDVIYQLRLNDRFDAWSQIDRIRVPVLMINMLGDNMVPVELGDAKKTAARLKNATYIEVNERPELGHGGLNPTIGVWGPRMRQWLAATLRP
jgi:homoserine O-acetyltransferase/O-succinyltransferase